MTLEKCSENRWVCFDELLEHAEGMYDDKQKCGGDFLERVRQTVYTLTWEEVAGCVKLIETDR